MKNKLIQLADKYSTQSNLNVLGDKITPLKKFPDVQLKSILNELYSHKCLQAKLSASIINAMYSQDKLTFIISRGILGKLFSVDAKIKRKAISSKEYSTLLSYLLNVSSEFEVLKLDSTEAGKRKGLIFTVRNISQFIQEYGFSRDVQFYENQRNEVLKAYNEYGQEKSFKKILSLQMILKGRTEALYVKFKNLLDQDGNSPSDLKDFILKNFDRETAFEAYRLLDSEYSSEKQLSFKTKYIKGFNYLLDAFCLSTDVLKLNYEFKGNIGFMLPRAFLPLESGHMQICYFESSFYHFYFCDSDHSLYYVGRDLQISFNKYPVGDGWLAIETLKLVDCEYRALDPVFKDYFEKTLFISKFNVREYIASEEYQELQRMISDDEEAS